MVYTYIYIYTGSCAAHGGIKLIFIERIAFPKVYKYFYSFISSPDGTYTVGCIYIILLYTVHVFRSFHSHLDISPPRHGGILIRTIYCCVYVCGVGDPSIFVSSCFPDRVVVKP